VSKLRLNALGQISRWKNLLFEEKQGRSDKKAVWQIELVALSGIGGNA
jgi:hypothetical protein